MSSFAIYLFGAILVVAGLAYAAFLAGVATQWIAIGVIVMIGLGVLSAVAKTRQKDRPTA